MSEEIRSLNADDLDIEELEARIEMSQIFPVMPNTLDCTTDCQCNCPRLLNCETFCT